MRSRFAALGVLAGSVLILAGIVIVFGIPGTGRVLGAIILILIGLGILLGPVWKSILRSNRFSVADTYRIHFATGDWVFDNANPAKRYSLMFGSGTLDLTQIKATKGPASVSLDVLFGELTISADDSIPVEIASDIFLAEVVLPDGTSFTGGKAEYRTRAAEKTAPILSLSGRVSFGQVNIIAKTVIKKIGQKE